jgi:hypothetical protein
MCGSAISARTVWRKTSPRAARRRARRGRRSPASGRNSFRKPGAAWRRKPDQYYPRIYGIEEAGGTSVLILSAVPFEQIGYPVNVEKTALPQYTWAALKHIPDVVVMGTVLLGGIHWLTHRKEEVARKEGRP